MIEVLQSVFLGIVQGVTEFLPVSSSAHLNIFPWLFRWTTLTESFDLALHIGTLLAVLLYFWREWIALIRGGVLAVTKKQQSTDGRIFWFIVIATIPAGLIGKLMEIGIEKMIGGNLNVEMIVISIALIIMGILLFIADRRCESNVTYQKMNFRQSFLIGMSQALAGAIPGVSRSGITMTVARSLKLDRESATKYSFLLSAPMVAGAALLSIGDFAFNAAFFIGILASFISGLFVIRFLMNYLKKGSYGIFAVYRIVIGVLIIGIAITRI